MSVRYKATTSSNTTGSLTAGVSFDSEYKPTDGPGVMRLFPRINTAVWKDAAMIVPASRMQEQRWMRTNKDGVKLWWTSSAQASTVPGGLWVTYTVVLANPYKA